MDCESSTPGVCRPTRSGDGQGRGFLQQMPTLPFRALHPTCTCLVYASARRAYLLAQQHMNLNSNLLLLSVSNPIHSSQFSRMHAIARHVAPGCGPPLSFLMFRSLLLPSPATFLLLCNISRSPSLLPHLTNVCQDLARHGYLRAGWQVWWRQAAFAKTSPPAFFLQPDGPSC
jgi:hypothetical protein